MQRRSWPTFLLAAALLTAGSDVAHADSLFGLSFFGEPTQISDARIEGRAGMGLAYRDSLNASVLQATQLADLVRVTIGVTNSLTRRNSEDAFGSLTRSGLITPTVRLGLPFFGRGGVGLGFVAQRATQWKLNRPFEGSADPDVFETIERSGTLFSVPLQLGLKVSDHLSVGAGLHLQRGNVRMRYSIDLPAGETDPLDVREDVYSGTAVELSMAVFDVGPLSVAGHWIGGYDADVDVRQRGVALSSRQDTSRTDKMPMRFGLGSRIVLPGDWSAGVDYNFEEWSAYEGRGFTFNEDGVYDPDGTAVELQDEIEWRVGFERESRRRGLRVTRPYRLGAYWRQWHYQLNGEDITEWGISAGTGISLRAGWARTDVSIGYSRIGNIDENGASEDVLRLVLSIAGGERWY